jgi:hypothetical protein
VGNNEIDDELEQLDDKDDEPRHPEDIVVENGNDDWMEIYNNEFPVVENGNQPQEPWLHPVTKATMENFDGEIMNLDFIQHSLTSLTNLLTTHFDDAIEIWNASAFVLCDFPPSHRSPQATMMFASIRSIPPVERRLCPWLIFMLRYRTSVLKASVDMW